MSLIFTDSMAKYWRETWKYILNVQCVANKIKQMNDFCKCLVRHERCLLIGTFAALFTTDGNLCELKEFGFKFGMNKLGLGFF